MIHVIDIETTGLDYWRNEILTCAVVTLDDDLKEVDRNEFRRRPSYLSQWTDEAENIHGISIETASKFPTEKKFRKDLKKYLQSYGEDSTFVCHAFPMFGKLDLIDYQFIFAEFNRISDHWFLYKIFPTGNILSTISRRNIYGLENQKLDTWSKFLKIDLDHHNAMSDALACADIYRYQKRNSIHEKTDRNRDRKINFGLFRTTT